MASSSQFETGNVYFIFYMEAYVTKQSIDSNKSYVTCDFYLKRTNTGYTTTGTFNWSMTINGVNYNDTWYGDVTYTAVKIASKEVEITHNTDGSKTLDMSASLSGYYSGSGGSWSMTLPTIPRTSSVSVNKSSADAGTVVRVSFSKPVSSFTQSAHMVINGTVYSICKDSSATYIDWTIPLAVMNHIPSATSGRFTIYNDTFNSGSLLGTTSTTINVTVPSNINPTIGSLSITRIDNGVPTAWGVYVKGKSKAKLTINSSAGTYGSWLTSSSISGAGANWNGSDITSGEIWHTGDISFTATVTDSRGRSASTSSSITVYDYWPPVINSCTATRCNSNGTYNPEGTYANVQINYSFASVNGKNTNGGGVWIRKKGATDWGTEIALTNATSKVIGGGTVDPNFSYEVFFRAKDAFNNIDRVIDLPSAKVTMDFKAGGNGMAIGKVSESDGLEVDWFSTFNKPAAFMNGVLVDKAVGVDCNTLANDHYCNTQATSANRPKDWCAVRNFGWKDDARARMQLAWFYGGGNEFYMRSQQDSTSNWNGWERVLTNGFCKNTFTDTANNDLEGFVQLDEINRLFYGWLNLTRDSGGWAMRTYTIPQCTQVYQAVATTARPAVCIAREKDGATVTFQMYEMEGTQGTLIKVRYFAIGR